MDAISLSDRFYYVLLLTKSKYSSLCNTVVSRRLKLQTTSKHKDLSESRPQTSGSDGVTKAWFHCFRRY